MKLFIFLSLVFILIPFTYGQEQKREELQAIIDETIRQNTEITAEQCRVDMKKERILQGAQPDILKTGLKPAKDYSGEAFIRQEITGRNLSKPNGVYIIAMIHQTQYDYNLLVVL